MKNNVNAKINLKQIFPLWDKIDESQMLVASFDYGALPTQNKALLTLNKVNEEVYCLKLMSSSGVLEPIYLNKNLEQQILVDENLRPLLGSDKIGDISDEKINQIFR